MYDVIFVNFVQKTDQHDTQQPPPVIITNFPRTLLKSKVEKTEKPLHPSPHSTHPKAKAKSKSKRKNADHDHEGEADVADANQPDGAPPRKRRQKKAQSWGRFQEKHALNVSIK